MTPEICADAVQSHTDEDLVGRLQAGDVDFAITALEQRYGRRIHHFVQGMVRDAHLASDVTQEVFEKVLLKNSLYRPGTNFRAWLFEVARNQALTMLRSRSRLPRPASTLQGADDEVVVVAVRREAVEVVAALERHLGRLRRPPACFQ